jgi:hypothetical protein
VGIEITQEEKRRGPAMATSRYEVEYEDGLKRTKLLSREHAEALGDQKGVKAVKKAADNKQRSGARNKSAGADGEDE